MGCAFEQVAEKVRLGLVWWEREGEDGKGKGEVLGSLVVSGGVASNQFLRTKSVSPLLYPFLHPLSPLALRTPQTDPLSHLDSAKHSIKPATQKCDSFSLHHRSAPTTPL